MQSGPDFFTWQMLEDWLSRYINMRTRAPETIEGMRSRAGEFEMVPVPKVILEQLAVEASGRDLTPTEQLALLSARAGGFVPFPAGVNGGVEFPASKRFTTMHIAETVAASKNARHADAAVALVKDLIAGVEKGDHSFVLSLVAEDYRDLTGRTKVELSGAIERLFKISSARRVILTSLDQYVASGSDLVLAVSGAWQAEIAGDLSTRTEVDSLTLELILTQDRDGRWKIATARHA